ncbi:MAG: hypothetical protein RMK29_13025 [Myxococcales bacterium]|nr:hypothetical protein [Myxococcota bacterium]MDW8282628.1 hypothetical protein [Myxococcales bacterium]
MGKRTQFWRLLAGLGAASGLVLAGCNDHTTGQPGEPEGPLRITRLTLLDDHVSRDIAVFSDTSAPRDCSKPPDKGTPRCENDPFKDTYGLLKSPPTPDSGRDIRVVFNKLPLRYNGMDLERITKEPMRPPTKIELIFQDIVQLQCAASCGLPPTTKHLRLTGSELSPDPTVFPYGPSVQITVDTDDPLAALEPDTEYVVEVAPGLSDRNDNKVLLDEAARRLLRFKVEPFKPLQVGIGDADHDTWVYTQETTQYRVEGLANNGVVAIRMNASVDPTVFQNNTATAQINGINIPVKLGLNTITKDKMGNLVCDPGNQRTLFIYPSGGTWGMMPGAGQQVVITIRGADVRDVSQMAGHPAGMGRNTLKTDLVVTATLSGKPADANYTGLKVGEVAADDDCPGAMMMDMAMAGDMRM